MTRYYRPIPMTDPQRSKDAMPLAGDWCWFDRAVCIERGREPRAVGIKDLPDEIFDNLTKTRRDVMGFSMAQPQVMGILNVTPDSFSDGGEFVDPQQSCAHAMTMIDDGATIIDIGGESTRPGAKEVPVAVEAKRVEGAIKAIREVSSLPISVDTRKADVATGVGALGYDAPWMINDVSAAMFDPEMASVAAVRPLGRPDCSRDSCWCEA